MITGNIKLKPPEITIISRKLLVNPEIKSLLETIREYYKQVQVIYYADLIMSNNEYETVYSEFGDYKKRINTSFRLIDLTGVIVYDEYLIFTVIDNTIINHIKVEISNDFFYFLEWEDGYYA